MLENTFSSSKSKAVADFVIQFYTSPATNPKLYNNIKQFLLDPETTFYQRRQARKALINLGYLNFTDFLDYSTHADWVQTLGGIPTHLIHTTLGLLVKKYILIQEGPGGLTGSQIEYQVNPNISQEFRNIEIIKNVIFGLEFIFNKYKNSIVLIEISKDDKCSAGTGFLYQLPSGNFVVITNHHVIQNFDRFKIIDSQNIEYQYLNTYMCDSDDIAVITLENSKPYNIETLRENCDLKVLSEIITVGYPSIPLSGSRPLVCHTGEVNSLVNTYFNQSLFIFSARTAPGSSGSPVIDKSGRFIGIVSENLFEKSDFEQKGILPYSAGVPSVRIMDFLKSVDLI